jgi:hypothetical protein
MALSTGRVSTTKACSAPLMIDLTDGLSNQK